MQALLRFTIENFRSFSERKSLLLGKGENQDTSTPTYQKVCALYGANSSGKSNLIRAVSNMRYLIKNSVKVNDGDELKHEPFLLSNKQEAPTFYEVEFLLDEGHYRYAFSNTATQIVDEWLVSIDPENNETPLFIRNLEGIGVHEERFAEGKDLEERTNDNRLFLSLVAQLGGALSKKIISFIIKSINTISGLDTEDYSAFSKQMLKKQDTVACEMKKFFERAQLGFTDVNTQLKDIDLNDLPSDLPQELKESIISQFTGKKSLSLFSVHGLYNEKGERVGEKSFRFEKMESEGTQKLFDISGPIFYTLNSGSILFIDELDAKMHPLMSIELVRLFANPETNPKGAQLVFTTHDTNLLSTKLLTQYQIWFTEKDEQERTDLYGLDEIKFLDGNPLPETNQIERNYIQGRYGAIPYFR